MSDQTKCPYCQHVFKATGLSGQVQCPACEQGFIAANLDDDDDEFRLEPLEGEASTASPRPAKRIEPEIGLVPLEEIPLVESSSVSDDDELKLAPVSDATPLSPNLKPAIKPSQPGAANQVGKSAKPRKRNGIPDCRDYVHTTCGGVTTVSEDSFENVSDPTSAVIWTYCTTCEDMFPLEEYSWEDTGESIVAFRERMESLVPPLMKTVDKLSIPVCAILVLVGIGLGVWLPVGVIWKVVGGIGGAVLGIVVFIIALTIARSALMSEDFREYI